MTLPGVVLTLVLAFLPGLAAAHGGLPGGGGFYSGAAHPFLAIEQLLGLLGLGLLLGKVSGDNSRLPLVVLAAALCAGLAAGPAYGRAEPVMLWMALLLGSVLAAALWMPLWGRLIAAGLTGWIVGTDTDLPAPSSPDLVVVFAPFAGVFVGVFLIVLNAAAFSSMGERPAARIAVRIVGSWLTAIALMVLALRLRGTEVTG